MLYFTTQPHYYSETHTVYSGIERFQSNEPVHVAVDRDEMIYTTDDDRHVLESHVTERVRRSLIYARSLLIPTALRHGINELIITAIIN